MDSDDESDGDGGAWDVRAHEFDDDADFLTAEGAEYTEEDEAVFNAFMRNGSAAAGGEGGGGGTLLADTIMAKLQARQGAAAAAASGDAAGAGPGSEMEATMQQVYTDVGTLLRRCAFPFHCLAVPLLSRSAAWPLRYVALPWLYRSVALSLALYQRKTVVASPSMHLKQLFPGQVFV